MIAKGKAQDERTRSSTLPPRIFISTILFTAICLPSVYQPFVSWLYGKLFRSNFYRFSGFETFLTMLCYITIEPLYTYKFGHNPHLRLDVRSKVQDAGKARPRLPKMKRPKDRLREILIYIAPLLAMDFVMIKKFAHVPINDIRISGGYAPVQSNTTVRPWFYYTNQPETSPFISPHFLLPTLHNFTRSSPLQLQRALPHEIPTSRRIVLELLASFFIYDMAFFLIHIAFHRIKPLARIHNPHHTHAEINPQVTNRLSVTERLSLILLANFALNIIGSHVLTRTIFVPFFIYLLIEVHCGMDLDWGYNKIMPPGWGAGPRVHAEHHRTGQGAYAPFFGWWDTWLQWAESKAQKTT